MIEGKLASYIHSQEVKLPCVCITWMSCTCVFPIIFVKGFSLLCLGRSHHHPHLPLSHYHHHYSLVLPSLTHTPCAPSLFTHSSATRSCIVSRRIREGKEEKGRVIIRQNKQEKEDRRRKEEECILLHTIIVLHKRALFLTLEVCR